MPMPEESYSWQIAKLCQRPRELGDFKGWVNFKLNYRLKGYVSANIYGALDGEWLYYKVFHAKKLLFD